MTDQTPAAPGHDEPQPEDFPDDIDLSDDDYDTENEDEQDAGPPHPVNWYLLSADALEEEWYELNRWVETLRRTYGLPASVIPPFWHRHDELVWELSSLHVHWLCAYHPEQDGSAPFGWHRDFADARQRLREWVAASGTRLDRDRPTRQTTWPGEDPADPVEDVFVADRDRDFVDYVAAQVAERRAAEDAFFAGADPATGEVLD
ncbi:hypothetical protein [Brevibacterium aurantiacum]|uniref:DUF4913 domain-containing protein n=1 Tax=Brevibacterium aurantiacum TaxID=273384 RepID=A0A3T0DHW6_BREAU|nr:hypothetical protein [Brevibacterium aurantiacum]AZT94727.1 hypothetical protein CXR23_17570 [Brevibacterium aurantiacum]